MRTFAEGDVMWLGKCGQHRNKNICLALRIFCEAFYKLMQGQWPSYIIFSHPTYVFFSQIWPCIELEGVCECG